MSDFKRVLILGTGPTSIQLAVSIKKHLNCYVGIAGRESVRSETFFEALKQSDHLIRVSVQNEKHRSMEGEYFVDQVFNGYETIKGEWDTIIFSVTTDAYIEVIKQISDKLLKQVKCIVLISPTFGSNSLISNFMNKLNLNAEIISFSTYYGDTRWMHDSPSNHVLTTAVKKKIYIGSTHFPSKNIDKLCKVYEQLGITLEIMKSPIEAETRNISLYVHPPLFMNDFSLSAIFWDIETKKYVYKIYPEGPITQYLIRDLLSQWKEIMNILKKINIKSINLLQFMTDDNYPVRLESLSRQDIENFNHLETIHQEYLLYIRYTSLLIDPFSEPDKDGRYFDFSAVPIRKMFVNKEGYLDIPRMPKEDYYRIKIIQGIAKYLELNCPTIDKFIKTYESKIEKVAQSRRGEFLSRAFVVQCFEEDLNMICGEIGKTIAAKTLE
ncbi:MULTISPECIES: opine metallophore biosynthesis dehydrogenase [Metabacillus]|jgi:staphylopine/pseudopaline/yersinopine synthase|uniref:Opine metallophore biosynthesis dehydrogenase n=1 Tax=Metabacillus rhizolycopersici TaxID=2875709 RepID=A0ABS7UYB4_9BACI|nr:MULTISPECIES: opine metallophore biosynthesis dehydrogenase [Metabacillus]MBZ5752920.1 opine metallophore biosynthesis dehydrogenase [Metabacillus rhizolycopersici]MCM3653722.1 opine metallophore biosynthesis dehydrogenase [Metabacillus litoralis]